MSENWDFYPCRVEDEPASIMVNLGMAAEAPVDALPQCAWLRVTIKNPREDGLSSSEEFDRLCEIGDALDEAVGEAAGKLKYVGRCTSSGRRDFYTYAESGLVAESVLSTVMTGFPEYEFETGYRADPEWRLYRGFLYPTEQSLQLIYNRRVLEVLEQNGDASHIPRSIRHFAYFSDAENADAFCKAVLEREFQVVARNLDEKSQKQSVIFERTDSVDFVEINNLTLDLLDLAKSLEGDYDGWETEVRTSEPRDSDD